MFFVELGWIVLSECLWSPDYVAFVRSLTRRLTRFNVLSVKVFQALALDQHWVDDALASELVKYTDSVGWSDDDYDFKVLTDVAEEQGLYLGDGIPLQSGMVSLVYKVTDKATGQLMILKLKRKNIEERIARDADHLLWLASWLPGCDLLYDVLAKNVDTLKQQTNFREEVRNMETMRENCKHLKYVVFPVPRVEVTEKHPDAILMTYLDGISIHMLPKEHHLSCAKLVVKFGLVTSLLHGLTHGDLHAGNLLFIKNANTNTYKLGVLDFGLVHKVDPHFKAVLFELVSQLFELPPRECAHKILHSGMLHPPNLEQVVPKKEYEELLCYTAGLIRETLHESRKANQVQIYKFLTKLKSCLAMYGVKPSVELTKSQLVLAMAHGVTLSLCEGKFVELLDTCMAELFRTDLLWKS